MLVWTIAVGGWLALTLANGAIDRTPLVLAVGGLFAVIWLLGLLIFGLFLAGGE